MHAVAEKVARAEDGTDQRSRLFREPVTSSDRVWLQDCKTNPMVINSIFTLDRLDDVDILRRLWQERVLDAADDRYVRFKRRIVFRGRRPFWEDDPDFDLTRHIVVSPIVEKEPGAISTREALQEYVGAEASKPLPGDRPPWQIQLIPDYRDGMSAVIIRIHHVMGDGLALVPVLFSLMDQEDGEGLDLTSTMARKVGKGITGWHVTAAALAGPFLLAQKMLWRADKSPIHGPELSGKKQVSWTDPISVDLVKALKNALGATVNDVLMSCIAGAFERYVASHPGEKLEQLRVSMPINVRPADRIPEMGNQFAAVLIPLPVGVSDGRSRVAAMKVRLDKVKRSVEPLFTYGAVRVLQRTMPWTWSHRLIDYLANKCSCVISNVPGPDAPLKVAERSLQGILFWVPQRAAIGIGVSVLSFHGEITVGVIADRAVMSDPRALVDAFHHELDELCESVGVS